MNLILAHRSLVSFALASAVGLALYFRLPFPDHFILRLIAYYNPALYTFLKYSTLFFFFSTPFILFSSLGALLYIFTSSKGADAQFSALPPYPHPVGRERLELVLGEVHHPRKPLPSREPRWLTVPSRGLCTGILMLGGVGSGKTAGAMYPYAEQLLAYRAHDPERKVGALVLEVKGDFCYKVREIVRKYGREDDYLELSLETDWRYNPLHNDLDPFAHAYQIAQLINNLYGKSKEPFWQMAYTNLCKFVITLHKLLYDYVTLYDVYHSAINPDELLRMIEEGNAKFYPADYALVDPEIFIESESLTAHGFLHDPDLDKYKAPLTADLAALLETTPIPFERLTASETIDTDRRAQFEAVKRWFEHDWAKIDQKLRTSIVEGISVFLSLFDDNPAIKRIFCPPKETYDPALNRDHRYGRPFPTFAEQIETGKVSALNFPVYVNPALARIVGTLMKMDYQRACMLRIPKMAADPERHFRETLFLCDEYQIFATAGESDPSGDDKFFSVSRQAKCIGIVASQSLSSFKSALPGESWRTLIQTFRTKVFLSLEDDFSQRTAAELCGKEDKLKLNYNFSESSQDAKVSMLTGRALSDKSSVTASKSYNVQHDFIFDPADFKQLKTYQAIVTAFDGTSPLPAQYCYLKPYFLDLRDNYFKQLAEGKI